MEISVTNHEVDQVLMDISTFILKVPPRRHFSLKIWSCIYENILLVTRTLFVSEYCMMYSDHKNNKFPGSRISRCQPVCAYFLPSQEIWWVISWVEDFFTRVPLFCHILFIFIQYKCQTYAIRHKVEPYSIISADRGGQFRVHFFHFFDIILHKHPNPSWNTAQLPYKWQNWHIDPAYFG